MKSLFHCACRNRSMKESFHIHYITYADLRSTTVFFHIATPSRITPTPESYAGSNPIIWTSDSTIHFGGALLLSHWTQIPISPTSTTVPSRLGRELLDTLVPICILSSFLFLMKVQFYWTSAHYCLRPSVSCFRFSIRLGECALGFGSVEINFCFLSFVKHNVSSVSAFSVSFVFH